MRLEGHHCGVVGMAEKSFDDDDDGDDDGDDDDAADDDDDGVG